MPQPAEPAPTTAMRCSVMGTPVTLTAASSVPAATAAGALDVVVEGEQPVAVALKDAAGIAPREVFPLQQHVRPALRDRGHEALDVSVIVVAPHALMLPADIEGIGEPLLIVGADVEQDGQRGGGVDAGAGRVERQLADGDAHAAGALVAQPQDALAVGDDDHLDLVEARMIEDRLEGVALRVAQEQPARIAPIVAELWHPSPTVGV